MLDPQMLQANDIRYYSSPCKIIPGGSGKKGNQQEFITANPKLLFIQVHSTTYKHIQDSFLKAILVLPYCNDA